jgi:hypothetical protein
VDSFLGQDPPISSSSIPGLTQPSSSASNDSRTFTTFFSSHQHPFGSQDSFAEAHKFQAEPKPPQGYEPQPQPFSVSYPVPSGSPHSYVPSSSGLQVAPVSSANSQALPTSPPSANQGLPGLWSYQSPQHGVVVENTSFHNPVPADPVPLSSDTSGHQAVPLFETSTLPISSSPSQLQYGAEVQSSSSFSVPLLATSQYQQYQPTVQQENSIPQSVPVSFPPIATVAPFGKFQYQGTSFL